MTVLEITAGVLRTLLCLVLLPVCLWIDWQDGHLSR